MGLAHACKSKGLIQAESHMKTQWEKVIEKRQFKYGFGLRFKDRSNAVNSKSKLQCSGQCKHIKTAIKQYTMHSDAQQVMEQKDLLI